VATSRREEPTHSTLRGVLEERHDVVKMTAGFVTLEEKTIFSTSCFTNAKYLKHVKSSVKWFAVFDK
jgi:hypothetical protein